MKNKIIVTGCAGLVGSECVRLLLENNYDVIGLDNFQRGDLFGEEGNTEETIKAFSEDPHFNHKNMDIRSDELAPILKEADGVIHTAAQPSHPKSIDIPEKDFEINVSATVSILETLRNHNSDCPFIFCSTNKVYGEMPNYFSYRETETRFVPEDPALRDGFDESLRIDQNMHTPFGVSKASADMYVQEYAHMYDLPAGVFRMGCITGSAAKAVEQHNWEPFFVKKALAGETLTIFGYKGKQVRDVIHAKDLSRLFLQYLEEPRPGEIYNVGGGPDNSISLLESIDLIEQLTGKSMDTEMGEERLADHQWWISDISKVKRHYPNWSLEISVEDTFEKIVSNLETSYTS